MKIWFKNSDPTKVISFGKSVGSGGEAYFEHVDEPVHGLDHDFYDITGGNTLVAKSLPVVDQIKADRVTAARQTATDREARLLTARDHAANGTPDTQPGQQKAIDLLYQILDDKGMLGV